MRRVAGIISLMAALATTSAGCGGGPALAKAGGTVTYHGKPLEGANVVYIPDTGSPGFGTTDNKGTFSWITQGRPGAMVGHGRVAITATEKYEFKSEESLTAKDLKKMGRSLIPAKYGKGETSGLEVTVNADGKNSFAFELTD